MAFFRGEEGSVKFKNGSGTVAAVNATRSWSLSLSKDVLDCTVQGKRKRNYRGGLTDGTGSAELYYEGGTGSTQEFIKDVLTVDDDADAQFELWLDGTDKKFAFKGIITGAEFGATVGDLTTVNVSFQVSDGLTADAF